MNDKYKIIKFMKAPTNPYKGSRDFYPEDKLIQKWMFGIWSNVVEKYGYQQYDSPVLEPTELYLIKGNDEIIESQTYTFKDRSDRSVTIRTEMTPSVSRMVAGRRQELAYPLRWYSIPNLWRYERMQRGRSREFWQLNVDLFGVKSSYAEIEMLHIIDDLFQAYQAKRSSYVIKVNSRVLVNTMLGYTCGMNTEQTTQLIRMIDKMNKMPADEFEAGINSITKHNKKTEKILRLLKIKGLEDLPNELQDSPSVKELKKVLEDCSNLGIRNVEFDISLMRGFDYYTDIVFEAFDTDPENPRSLLGGGRYDGLVGLFGVESIPTVGFAVGDVGFLNFLQTHKLVPDLKNVVDVILIIKNIENTVTAQELARELRSVGVNTAVDYSARKVSKQLKSATKSGARYLIFVNSPDVDSSEIILKDNKTKKEQDFTKKQVVAFLKDNVT